MPRDHHGSRLIGANSTDHFPDRHGLGMAGQRGRAGRGADSPAGAGVMSGDVITAVDGTAVKDAGDLAKTIGAMAPGASAKLTIWRKGERRASR
jgi:S1-C subfamily serine protease